jgi:hypothetical protein
MKEICQKLNINSENFILTNEAAENISKRCTYRGSLREVKKLLSDIILKINFLVQHKNELNVSFQVIKELSYPVTITDNILSYIVKTSPGSHNLSYIF